MSGMKATFNELLKRKGVNAIVSTDIIKDELGSSSGYVGLLIHDFVKKGILMRVTHEPHVVQKYKIIRLPKGGE